MENQPKPMKLGQLSVVDALDTDGFDFVNQDENGIITAKNRESGDEVVIRDRNKYLSSYLKRREPDLAKEITLDNFDITNNNKDTAVESNPVSILDRARLSLGNMKGTKKFLQENFDEVDMNKNGDVVVRKGDTWHKLDKSGLGNGTALDMLEEFVGDTADTFGTAVQIIPSLLATPTIAGTVAGAAVGTGLKTAMGQALGTYEGDADEMIQDLAMETVMGLGGFGVGKVAGALGNKAFKYVDKVPNPLNMLRGLAAIKAEAPEQTHNFAATLMSFATGRPKEAMVHLVGYADEVAETLGKYVGTGKTKGLKDVAANMSTDIANSGAETIELGLKGIFDQARQMEDEFIAANKGMTIDIQGPMNELFGISPVSVVDPITKMPVKDKIGMANDKFLSSLLKADTENQLFNTISDEEFSSLVKNLPLRDRFEYGELFEGLKVFTKNINKARVPASASVQDAINIVRSMDDLIFSGKLNPETVSALRVYTQPFRKSITDKLKGSAKGELYVARNNFLTSNSDKIIEAKRLLNSDNKQAFQNYIESVFSPIGTNDVNRAFMNGIAELGGEAANKAFHNAKNIISARNVLEVNPIPKNMSSGPGLILGAATYGATEDLGDAGMVGGLGALALTSPRVALKAAQASGKLSRLSTVGKEKIVNSLYNTKEIITRLSLPEKARVMKSPEELGRLLAPVFQDFQEAEMPQE